MEKIRKTGALQASLPTSATRFASIRAKLETFQPKPGLQSWLYEFLLFGFKQGWACLFGALMLALLLGTHYFYPKDAPLARYDFLTLSAIAIQAGMLAFRLETWREARVIAVFHVVGTIMELFKTHAGSWQYPESGVLHIGAVPLFSGFMYAAVGSYIARIWRIFDIRLEPYPPLWTTAVLAGAIYVNFFAHHWLPDIRAGLFVATALLFWRARFHYTPFHHERQMPVLLGFFLVSLFIWFAENIGTFARAWTYPNQQGGWHMVSFAKLGSWYLLMIISVVLVSLLHADGKRKAALPEIVLPKRRSANAIFVPMWTMIAILGAALPQPDHKRAIVSLIAVGAAWVAIAIALQHLRLAGRGKAPARVLGVMLVVTIGACWLSEYRPDIPSLSATAEIIAIGGMAMSVALSLAISILGLRVAKPGASSDLRQR